MAKLIKITCLNNNLTKEYETGISLQKIAEDMKIKLKAPILGARVNNLLTEFDYELFKPKIVEFIDITNIDGFRMYQRSLSFVLMKAVSDLFPDRLLKIEHSIAGGYYCEVEHHKHILTKDEVDKIKNRMREIIDANLPFQREEILTSEAINIFENNKMQEKAQLFKARPLLYTSVYKLDNLIDYFYGYLVPSTGYLDIFELVPYYEGMLLKFPLITNPKQVGEIYYQAKLFDIFREHKEWGEVLGVSSIGDVNEQITKGNVGELIKISEALHEKKVAEIADNIKKQGTKKVILIAGPSSSGKTTFAKRLCVQLIVNGLKPVQISLDNYFVDRELTPLDENGEYDFESFYALDIETFNRDILDLINGKEIAVSQFSFETGKRFYTGAKMQITDQHIILIEGIHALNPKLSELIDSNLKYKIYISALTQIGIDLHNRIPSTDNRLLRRIVRDYQYRGYTAIETIRRWPSVRRGEEKNIFPYQEEADVMFNSALLFELGVLKSRAEPILNEIDETNREYSEARRLLKFLSYFHSVPDKEIPPTSILREFLSGSSFKY